MTHSLQQIILDAKEELQQQWQQSEYPEDQIHEITDSACLMSNYDYLQLAAANTSLALDEPECGPAFDGTPTPINVICANLYELISGELHQHLYELQSELDEAA